MVDIDELKKILLLIHKSIELINDKVNELEERIEDIENKRGN